MVNSFSHFIFNAYRSGYWRSAIYACGSKVDHRLVCAKKERGTALGIFNSSTVIGQAIAPPALVLMQLAWGWRTMFVIIGVAGILVGICWYAWYRNRAQFVLTEEERTYLPRRLNRVHSYNLASGWRCLSIGQPGDDFRFLWRQLYRLALHRVVTRLFGRPNKVSVWRKPVGWRQFLSSRRRSGCGLTVLLSIGWRKKAMTWRRRVKRRLSAV